MITTARAFRKKCLECQVSIDITKGPFIFYEGRGTGGIWETPFKNCMTPPQLTNFFTWPPLRAVFFLDDPPPPPSRFYLFIFSIIPILDVIVLTMKTKFTIPISTTGSSSVKKNTNQKKEKLNQLYILYSNTVCFWHYQGITIHTTVASVTFRK